MAAVAIQTATFSMYCYWTGEATLDRVAGVVATRIGDLDGSEVVQVDYDPARVTVADLIVALKTQDSFYAQIKSPHEAPRFVASKHTLRTTHPELFALGLTEAQAMALNSWSYFGGPMPDVLTPEQHARLKQTKPASP